MSATIVARQLQAAVASTSSRPVATHISQRGRQTFRSLPRPAGLGSQQQRERGSSLVTFAARDDRTVRERKTATTYAELARFCTEFPTFAYRSCVRFYVLSFSPLQNESKPQPLAVGAEAEPHFLEPLLRGLVLGVGAGILCEVLHVAFKVQIADNEC